MSIAVLFLKNQGRGHKGARELPQGAGGLRRTRAGRGGLSEWALQDMWCLSCVRHLPHRQDPGASEFRVMGAQGKWV